MKKLKEFLQSKKAYRLIAVLGITGILAVFLSEIIPNGTEESTAVVSSEESDWKITAEEEVKKLVAEISGDENASVAITFETGKEYVYATAKDSDSARKNNKNGEQNYNSETSDKTAEQYIIINNGSCEQPLLLYTREPTVRGVAIVCNAGADENVCESIINAVCTLFDISRRDVEVCGRNNIE